MLEWFARSWVALGVVWQAVVPGVWRAEVPMAEDGPLEHVRAIAIRLDPKRLQFELARRGEDVPGGWTVDATPDSAVVAFNAGQFTGVTPWGWLLRNGEELQSPGTGALTMSFVVDSAGAVSLVTPAELPAARTRARTAFQSYPTLLSAKGDVPWELRAEGRGVDLRHRDSRLALGTLGDGTVVVVLTRFIGLGEAAQTLPWGPTVREMAAFMRSLGCERAMLLDGGISGQMALRDGSGELKRWKNWRAVPLGLVVTPRTSKE
jgi:exopolysaccharide biosynthesis protein